MAGIINDVLSGASLTVASPVTVSNGGTGNITLLDHGLLVGSGTSATDAVAVGSTGSLLIGSTGADPAFSVGGVIAVSGAGETTWPLQPAFLGYLAASATNKTGNNTAYTLGTDALTEVYDQNGDFNTNGTFTAPVTGIYDLRAQVTLTDTGNSTSFVISIVTTARTYTSTFTKAAATTDQTVSISTLADMAATNTATVTITANGAGADTVDIKGGAVLETYFCGKLVA